MIEKRLKDIRKAHGLTQQNIADSLGIDRTTYTYYETGSTCPSIESIRKIARIYKVSVAYLIGETDVPEVESEDTDFAMVAENVDFSKTLTKNEKELIVYFRSLNKADKEKALECIKDIVKDTLNK